jgi:hypothetical protein
MADVSGNQHLIRQLAGEKQLPVGKRPRRKIAVDVDAVRFVLHRSPEIVRHAEAPIVSEVTRTIGNKLGLVGKCVDVLRKLSAAHLFVNRLAVAYDVQIVVRKINETTTVERPNRSAPNVPFQRDLPIEHRSPTGNFSDL